jgi:hypothetical protein
MMGRERCYIYIKAETGGEEIRTRGARGSEVLGSRSEGAVSGSEVWGAGAREQGVGVRK